MDKWTDKNTGCIIDGHHGQYIYGYIVDLAVDHGYPITEEDRNCRCFDYLVDGIANNAEKWLNENLASEGYRFGWHDGEYFFQSDEWWSEES